MSFLYDKRTKSAIAWIWGVIVVVITFSMIIAYSGLTNYFQQQGQVAATPATTTTATPPPVQTAPLTVSSTGAVKVQAVSPTKTAAAPAATVPAKDQATFGF